MRTIIIGNLTKVGAIETKESYSLQQIEITHQEYDSLTGSAKIPEVYPITIFNKKIAELKAESFSGQNVIATCWLKSLKNEKDGKVFYNIALNCSHIAKTQ